MLPTALAHTAKPKSRDMAPVQTLGNAAAKCSTQAKAYGACVASNYENIERNMCAHEFKLFKHCVQQHLGRRW
ncbi:hypothetical protein BCV70DRAFT_199301 [Testicularia cyperi]|uniref:CHCH domain-containing protein n=1 Tax=Testicularia cyperi TaxID=1882483 RepID=A0A317XT41_9BASI|nr:hypothetical protein BCV70DRAFT_199301 [Testicularia cyperi]